MFEQDNGWTVDQIADEISSRPFLHGTSQLCQPLSGCVALREAGDFGLLCSWGYFNPHGPTYENLLAVESPKGTWLLYRQSMSPFAQLDVVYGAPLQVGNDQRDPMHLAVGELLASNGGKKIPLLDGLPDFIFRGDEETLNTALRDHFFAGAALLDAADLTTQCDAISTHWCHPWDLADEAVHRALRAIVERPVRSSRPNTATKSSTITRELFDRWWSLVYESEHGAACFNQMKEAWEGAIKSQADVGKSLHAMPFQQAQRFLKGPRQMKGCSDVGEGTADGVSSQRHLVGASLNASNDMVPTGGPSVDKKLSDSFPVTIGPTEINGYRLKSHAGSYPKGSLTAFGAESYAWAAFHGIERVFPDETFYWAANNTLFGQKCTEAIVATVKDVIYKIAFRHFAKNQPDCILFREMIYQHLLTRLGMEQDRREIGDTKLLIWQSSHGNMILELEGYQTTILLTSSLIRETCKGNC
jgi:hypothetical protein